MIPQNQEFTAGRIQPSQFDTELPPDARAEMLKPKRPRILTRPPGPRQKPLGVNSAWSWRHPAFGWLLALAGVVAVYAIISWSQLTPASRAKALQESADRSRETDQKAAKAPDALKSGPPSPAPVVQPTPMPAQPVSQPPGPPPPAVIAPRARLVLFKRWLGNSVWELTDSTGRAVKILVDPAPRAHLVRAPEWQPGQARIMRMPYDMEVQGVLKGSLSDEAFLPRSGNAIGDTWIVGRTPWIWITTPGTAVPQWVDP